jgi:hypothetical protein
VTATFVKISSSKEDYLKVIENLKENAPPPIKEGERRPKMDTAHFALITVLESRIEAVDAELQVQLFLSFPLFVLNVHELSAHYKSTKENASKAIGSCSGGGDECKRSPDSQIFAQARLCVFQWRRRGTSLFSKNYNSSHA